MIGLRADHDVDRRLAAGDLGALGLGDAARDGNSEVLAPGAALDLEVAHAAKLGIDLFRGMLADMAGVQHDEIGLLRRRGQIIAERPQDVGHAVGVVDVHLAPIGPDEHMLALPVGAHEGLLNRLLERAGF
jgi:hypothetical protein